MGDTDIDEWFDLKKSKIENNLLSPSKGHGQQCANRFSLDGELEEPDMSFINFNRTVKNRDRDFSPTKIPIKWSPKNTKKLHIESSLEFTAKKTSKRDQEDEIITNENVNSRNHIDNCNMKESKETKKIELISKKVVKKKLVRYTNNSLKSVSKPKCDNKLPTRPGKARSEPIQMEYVSKIPQFKHILKKGLTVKKSTKKSIKKSTKKSTKKSIKKSIKKPIKKSKKETKTRYSVKNDSKETLL